MKLKLILFLAINSVTLSSFYSEGDQVQKKRCLIKSCTCYMSLASCITGAICAAKFKLSGGLIIASVFGGTFGGMLVGYLGSTVIFVKYRKYKEKKDVYYQFAHFDYNGAIETLKKNPKICNELHISGYTALDGFLELIRDRDRRELEEILLNIDLEAKTIDNAYIVCKLERNRTNNRDFELLQKIREKYFKRIISEKLKMLPNEIIKLLLDYKPEILNLEDIVSQIVVI